MKATKTEKRIENQKINHPKKGSIIKVEPIRRTKDINLIKKNLQDKPLDYAYFMVGINTALRASDILNLKINQIKDLKPGDKLTIREKKTKKLKNQTFNQNAVNAIQNALKCRVYQDDDYLFTGQRGQWQVPTATNKVKQWCRDINLQGNYGSHSLRKTWAYHARGGENAAPTFIIMQALNHSSEKETLKYLCIEPKEVDDAFMGHGL